MTKPAFTQVTQIGIVVRDLDKAIVTYEKDYGIGPWTIYQFKPGDVKVWKDDGVEGEPARTRFAAAMVGNVQWELIQPLDGKSTFAKFLAEKGEGVHHVAVRSADYEELMRAETGRGTTPHMECALGGQFEGIKVAYLGSKDDLGVTLEVFNAAPGEV